MNKPLLQTGDPVQVLCYNSKTRECEWRDAKVLSVIEADDIPFRIEVQLSNGIELTGFDAPHPDCVKKIELEPVI
jgi:hypothetical protein